MSILSGVNFGSRHPEAICGRIEPKSKWSMLSSKHSSSDDRANNSWQVEKNVENSITIKRIESETKSNLENRRFRFIGLSNESGLTANQFGVHLASGEALIKHADQLPGFSAFNHRQRFDLRILHFLQGLG